MLAEYQGGELDELTRFSALIDRIYQGATDVRAWPSIMEALARWMGASKGLLFTPMSDPRVDGFVFPYAITESTLELWASVHMPQDLWRNRAAERGLIRSGGITLDTELATTAELMASAWYQDFLAPIGIGRAIMGVVFEPGHADMPMTAVSLFRPLEAQPYDEQDRARFQLVFPHLSRALGVMMTLRDAEFRVAASQAGLDRL